MNKRLLTAVACLILTGAVLYAVEKSNDPSKKSPSAATQAAKAINKFCAVEHENPIDPTVPTVTYKGQVIGFCCEDCIPKFNKRPEFYMKDIK